MKLASPALQPALEALKALAIAFSVVSLITLQFLRNSLPAPHIFLVPSALMAKAILLLVVLPALVLLAVDRLIAWRFSPRTLLLYRSALMIGALVIALRQLQLFWSPTARLAEEIQLAVPFVFPLLFAALCGLIAFAVLKYHAIASSFFFYFAPAALLIVVLTPLEKTREGKAFEVYGDQEVVRPAADTPPVYVIVFDEFSFEALLGPDRQIDATAYPNFARLATEGMYLTNATTNHFYTWLVVPELIDSVLSLSGEYEVRLYEQAQRIEGYFAPTCGSEITCRGVRHLTLTEDSFALSLGARAFYSLLPDRVESLASPVLHPLLRAAGVLPPTADPLGIHMASRELLSLYLSDINASDARGRISFMHSLLPHHPFVLNSNGDFESDEYRRIGALLPDGSNAALFESRWLQYKEQIRYVDDFVGDLLARLEQQGLLDEATIIITADHGMRLNFPLQSIPIEVDSLVTGIPLFILAPGVKPGVSELDYQHIDFGPTLYDLLGLDPASAPEPNTSLAAGPAVSVLAEDRPDRSKLFLVYDYKNRPYYWSYILDGQTGVWHAGEDIDWLAGDRTQGLGQIGDLDTPE